MFDAYVAVDWSAANTPTRGKDSIWVAANAVGPKTADASRNIPTRAEAVTYLTDELLSLLDEKKRVLIGFDFGFGYPRGFAKALTGAAGWSSVWDALQEAVEDDDDNRSNRFEVASDFNRKLGGAQFWGKPHQHQKRYRYLPAKKPLGAPLPERRLVEHSVASAKSVFQMAYNGAVGSQTMLGIARLQQLRQQLGHHEVRVWPFETSFADDLPKGPSVVFAEIYPTLFLKEAPADDVKDKAQVEAVVEAVSALDAEHQLGPLLTPPPDTTPADVAVMVSEEGSIVGAGRL